MWWAWAWTNDYVRPTTAAKRADLIGKVAQITGGAILAYGAYWTARKVLVNREGQITERFTRAIDQLGATDDADNPRLEIRLGAIYALERIAGDSPARVNAAGNTMGHRSKRPKSAQPGSPQFVGVSQEWTASNGLVRSVVAWVVAAGTEHGKLMVSKTTVC